MNCWIRCRSGLRSRTPLLKPLHGSLLEIQMPRCKVFQLRYDPGRPLRTVLGWFADNPHSFVFNYTNISVSQGSFTCTTQKATSGHGHPVKRPILLILCYVSTPNGPDFVQRKSAALTSTPHRPNHSGFGALQQHARLSVRRCKICSCETAWSPFAQFTSECG